MKAKVWIWMMVVAAGSAAAAIGAARRPPPPSDDGVADALEGAIAFWEARVAARPEDAVGLLQVADRYMMRFGHERGFPDVWRAESALVRAQAVLPAYAPAIARFVPVHIARHEFPEAERAAEMAFRIAPRRSTNGLLFDAYFERGAYDSATVALGRMDPHSFGYLIRRARFAEQRGDLTTARRALTRACRPDQPDVRAWCLVRLADMDRADGRWAAASQGYGEVLARNPHNPAALMGLADLAFAGGRLQDAKAYFERAVTLPGTAEAHLALGRIALLERDTERAGRHRMAFERVAAAPEAGRAYWSALARFYGEEGRVDTAIALALRDVEQRPGPESYHTLAAVQLETGDAAAAARSMATALQWGPPDADMAFDGALIELALGNVKEAAERFRESLDDPAGLAWDRVLAARAQLLVVE